MTSRKTSIQLIEKAVSEKWIRQLAFYHLLKLRFNNGCIYSYKSRMDEIARSLNISTKTLYNYLNFLRSKDLVYDHVNNLMLKSIREFKTRKKCTLYIESDYNLFDVTCLLYAKLIEKKSRQMAFKESLRRCGGVDRLNVMLCENPFRPSLSVRTMAKLINVSKTNVLVVIKNLNRLNVIETTKQKSQLISYNFTDLDSIKDYPGYRYNVGSKLFEIFGARVNFLQFPVYLKKISLKQFKAMKSSISH